MRASSCCPLQRQRLEFPQRAEVGRVAEAGRIVERAGAGVDARDRAEQQGTERVLVRVDLEQAVTAGRGEQMRRGALAPAAAEIMRAVAPAGGARAARHLEAARDAAPLG